MMRSLRTLSDSLYSNKLMYGFWDTVGECTGTHPDAREGHGMAIVNNQLYVFGGFARNLFNDMKVLNLETKHWTHLMHKEGTFWPKLRTQFSMCQFGEDLYVFGGLGPSLKDTAKSENTTSKPMENASPKECYNMLLCFNTVTQSWRKLDAENPNVEKRYGHIGAMGGCLMLIHGGRNSIQRKVF